MSNVYLHTLPKDHPLRNIALKDLDAECRNKQNTAWRPVKTWKIGTATYNELGSVWTELDEFRISDTFLNKSVDEKAPNER